MKLNQLHYTLLLAALLCGTVTYAQNWVAKMQNPNVNFFEVKNAFAQQNAEKEKEMLKERIINGGNSLKSASLKKEIPGYSQYKRWEWFMAPRVSATGERFDPSMVWNEMVKYNNSNRGMLTGAGNWTFIGPATSSSLSGAGRLNFVRIHPNDPNTLFVGSPSGGLWKSTNGGASWTSNTDSIAQVIGCTDLAIDPTNTNIMYLATGDGDASDNYSVGILKSTDAGNTWNTTGLSYSMGNMKMMSKILLNPNNTNILIVATSAGVYRSTDAGVNFTQVQAGSFKDMEFMPGNPNTVYACGTQFYRSVDNGVTWTIIISGLPTVDNVSRMAIAVTPANANYVYMIVGLPAPNYGTEGFYRSTDAGQNFTQYLTPSLGTQQWYDLCIAANPTNAQEVMVGGQTQFQKSTNGGTSWSNIVGGMHVDHHDVIYTSSTTLYVANDGGLYRSTTNGGNWANLNNNLAISQMYGFGQSASNANLLITGWQDNGTNRFNGAWSVSMGGDGMLAFIGRTNDNNMWGSQYNGSLNRSTTGGGVGSWSNATTGITEAGGWVTPWREDPVTANTLWAGFINVWKSTNGGQSWTRPGIITGNTATMAAIAVSPANNQVIWASTGGYLYKSVNGGTTWTSITSVPSGYKSYITCHNTDANKAWVTFSGFNAANKVYQTVDQGTTWTDAASQSLPNIPVNCLAYMNGSNGGLYIGTDVGVFFKNDTINVWQPVTNGLPNVVVTQLEIFYTGSKIRVSTYGRGVWESDYYQPGNYPPYAHFTANQTISCAGTAIQFTDYSAGFPTQWSWSFPGGSPSTSTQQNPLVVYNAPGVYAVTLTSTNGAGSDTRTVNSFITISASTVNPPTANSVDFCAPATVNLSATPAAPGIVRWWDSPGGGTLLATGNTYSPFLTVTDSFYVDEDFSGGVQDQVGELDNFIGAGTFFTANDIRGLYFDVTEPVVLNTVQVYSNSSNNRTIEVIDGQGNTYIDTTVFIPADPNNLQTVALNFTLYPGTGYFIKCRGYVDLFRNSSGANFPYNPVGTTNSVHVTGTNAGSGGYYYFFYNWDYKTFVCNTARTPVFATDTCALSVNDIFGGNNDLSIYPNPNSGLFNVAFNSGHRDDFKINLANSLGQIVYTEKLIAFQGKYEKAIDIRRHGKGVYMLSISNSKNQTVRRVVSY